MMFRFFLCPMVLVLLISSCGDSSSPASPPAVYSVIYHEDGATNGEAPVDNNQYMANESVFILPNESLVSTNSFFAGWNTGADGSGAFLLDSKTIQMPARDLHLYPRWLPDISSDVLLSVTYRSDGSDSGTVPVDSNYYINGYQEAVVRAPGTLAKTGYTFSHWEEASGAAWQPLDTILMLKNVTLIPQWSALNKTPMPTSSPAPGDYSRSIRVRLASANEDALIHYTLDGSTPTESSSLYSGPIELSESAEIRAIAAADGQADSDVMRADYKLGGTLYYNLKGGNDSSGSIPEPLWYEAESSVLITSSVPTKNNHAFESWNTKSNGKGTDYEAGDMIEMTLGEITLYARWGKNER